MKVWEANIAWMNGWGGVGVGRGGGVIKLVMVIVIIIVIFIIIIIIINIIVIMLLLSLFLQLIVIFMYIKCVNMFVKWLFGQKPNKLFEFWTVLFQDVAEVLDPNRCESCYGAESDEMK